LHLEVVPAVLRFVLDLFRQLIEGIERFLYTVDEWLRFRTGESGVSLVIKGGLGLVWFFVTYVVRIYVNLLIEPTVNPIKHFPVVTVAAKLILPFAPLLLHYMALPFQPLGHAVAYSIAFTNFILIPGAFGFLLWELKENWRLYEANRPAALQPVPIGHHGETMARLLRAAFHSGTIPKVYARLRRALRGTSNSDAWKAVHRQEEILHHVADRLHKFADREFVALLNGCQHQDMLRLRLENVAVSTNRIVLNFANDCMNHGSGVSGQASGDLSIAFAEEAGWITASVLQSGWVDSLSGGSAVAVREALLGLYKLAGVDLLEEDLVNLVVPLSGRYDLAERQIKFWFESNSSPPSLTPDRSLLASRPSPLVLQLREGELQLASPGPDSPERRAVGKAAFKLLFRNTPIMWKWWVEAWQELAGHSNRQAPILSAEEVA
jgi:hypothetical protein